MMQMYRFVGTVAEVGPLKFERFGQRVEMEPEVALAAQVGGCALVLDTDFQRHGFTTEDLKVWADPFVDPFDVPTVEAEKQAKAKFLARQVAVRAEFAELRQRLVAERRAKEQPQEVETANGEMPEAAESLTDKE